MLEPLDDDKLRGCLDFILKADALKKVLRKTRVIKNARLENTAEHSWHLILMALVLRNYANSPIDLLRVIKMLIVHDLGEIEVGDYHLYDPARLDAHDREKAAVENLFSVLPCDLAAELMELWIEFSDGKTADAHFARSLDRFQPFLTNVANDGGSWKGLNITRSMALAKNSHIADGSETLWDAYQLLAKQADENGLFGSPKLNQDDGQ